MTVSGSFNFHEKSQSAATTVTTDWLHYIYI